jgi:hypothetical protein
MVVVSVRAYCQSLLFSAKVEVSRKVPAQLPCVNVYLCVCLRVLIR